MKNGSNWNAKFPWELKDNNKSLSNWQNSQIRRYLQENKPHINHQFDIWHMAKNLKKKLLNLGKKKNCDIINSWIKSIINHFWWLCSTCNGSSDLLNKKWLSLLYHIRGIHQWQIYCEHEKLADVQQIKKIWLDGKSKTYTELQGVVNDKALLKDFKQVSVVRHTEQLKVYHSWIT